MLNLICIDGSKHSEKEFEWYCDNIHKEGVTVGLAHAHQPPEIPVVGMLDSGFSLGESYTIALEESIKESKELMEKYECLCKERKIETIKFLRNCTCSPGETICGVAKESNARMIVIGQRGLGVIRRTLFGSVSDYVLHHSHLPTLVIPAAHKK